MVSLGSNLVRQVGAARARRGGKRNRWLRPSGILFDNNACLFAVQQKKQDYLCGSNFIAPIEGWILPAKNQPPQLARARRGFRRALSLNHQPACKPGSVRRGLLPARQPFLWDGDCSPPQAANPNDGSGGGSRDCSRRHSYLALLPVGFAVPWLLPATRWALTPPFHPYSNRSSSGLLSVALSLGSPPPDVIRHRVSVEPGLSSTR